MKLLFYLDCWGHKEEVGTGNDRAPCGPRFLRSMNNLGILEGKLGCFIDTARRRGPIKEALPEPVPLQWGHRPSRSCWEHPVRQQRCTALVASLRRWR